MPALLFSADINSTATYPVSPQIDLTVAPAIFQPDQWHMKNLSIDTGYFYSFDGKIDSGFVDFTPAAVKGLSNIGDYVKSKLARLWLRRAAVSGTSIVYVVQVWTYI
jgi:hypothetical protein